MYPLLFQDALYINSELLSEYKSIIDQFDNERISTYNVTSINISKTIKNRKLFEIKSDK